MELLQVFDKDRNKLDESIDRKLKKELPEGKYFMIILLFIQNSAGKFLVQKTSSNRDGEYAFTGGHVTRGDDALTTVIKEAKEELGIIITKDEIKEIDFMTVKCCHIGIYYILKDIDINNLNLQIDEVSSVEFLNVDEIDNLIKDGNFRKTHIEAYYKVLNQKGIRNGSRKSN